MKISLRELLVVVAFLAVGCAALLNASHGWWGFVGTGATCLVMAAAIVAVFDRGGRQISAIGFLICSLSYFGIVHIQVSDKGYNTEYYPNMTSKLPSTSLLKICYHSFAEESFDTTTQITWYSPDGPTFMRIGHTLVMLILGYLGGHFARFVFFRRLRETTPPSET